MECVVNHEKYYLLRTGINKQNKYRLIPNLENDFTMIF